MFSIILSTMFIKQHSTFDVITALLLCAVMDRIVYRDRNRAASKTVRRGGSTAVKPIS
jgi:hypothetical protein